MPTDLSLETKAREQTLVLRGCSHVEVRGIELFGGTFDLTDAHHCVLENVASFYSNHFARTAQKVPPYPANRIKGNHNTVRRCHIAYSAGTGLDIQGEGNTLSNCVIHDIGYMGTYEGAVQVKGTKGTVIDHSSNNFCKNFVVHHNVVWACGSSGITLNCDALNHLVANNTITQCPKGLRYLRLSSLLARPVRHAHREQLALVPL